MPNIWDAEAHALRGRGVYDSLGGLKITGNGKSLHKMFILSMVTIKYIHVNLVGMANIKKPEAPILIEYLRNEYYIKLIEKMIELHRKPNIRHTSQQCAVGRDGFFID